MVITGHHQLWVDRAVPVGRISPGTHGPGGVLPLLEQVPGDHLAQLPIGLLPGLADSGYHFYRHLTWTAERRCAGEGSIQRQQPKAQEQKTLHRFTSLRVQDMPAQRAWVRALAY